MRALEELIHSEPHDVPPGVSLTESTGEFTFPEAAPTTCGDLTSRAPSGSICTTTVLLTRAFPPCEPLGRPNPPGKCRVWRCQGLQPPRYWRRNCRCGVETRRRPTQRQQCAAQLDQVGYYPFVNFWGQRLAPRSLAPAVCTRSKPQGLENPGPVGGPGSPLGRYQGIRRTAPTCIAVRWPRPQFAARE